MTTTTPSVKATTTVTRNAKVAADSAKLAESLNGNPATEINPATGRKRAVAKPATAKTDSAGKVTKVAASKPAVSKPAAEPKTVPASRVLARQLVEVAAAAFADASDADRQRIANYLKIVTTGTDEEGRRWWPANFPRPTHFSWA